MSMLQKCSLKVNMCHDIILVGTVMTVSETPVSNLVVDMCSALSCCKGDYSYDASVTDMLNDLKWESLESRREHVQLMLPFTTSSSPSRHFLQYNLVIC